MSSIPLSAMVQRPKFDSLPQSEPMQLTVDIPEKSRQESSDSSSSSDKNALSKQGSNVISEKHKCSICNKHFRYPHSLELHLMNHNGIKPFKCKECAAKFVCRTALEVHARKHTGERPYMCTICNQSFVQSTHLQMHKRTHSSAKPFKCLQCSKAFKFEQSLKIHILEHGDQWDFKCEVCKKLFTTSKKLKNHQKVHSLVKQYKCDNCGKHFRDAAYVTKHQAQFCGNDGYKERWKRASLTLKPKRKKASKSNCDVDSETLLARRGRGRPKGSLNKKTRRRSRVKFKAPVESDLELDNLITADNSSRVDSDLTNTNNNLGSSSKHNPSNSDDSFLLDVIGDDDDLNSPIGYIDLSYKSLQNSLKFKRNEVLLIGENYASQRKYHDKPDTVKLSSTCQELPIDACKRVDNKQVLDHITGKNISSSCFSVSEISSVSSSVAQNRISSVEVKPISTVKTRSSSKLHPVPQAQSTKSLANSHQFMQQMNVSKKNASKQEDVSRHQGSSSMVNSVARTQQQKTSTQISMQQHALHSQQRLGQQSHLAEQPSSSAPRRDYQVSSQHATSTAQQSLSHSLQVSCQSESCRSISHQSANDVAHSEQSFPQEVHPCFSSQSGQLEASQLQSHFSQQCQSLQQSHSELQSLSQQQNLSKPQQQVQLLEKNSFEHHNQQISHGRQQSHFQKQQSQLLSRNQHESRSSQELRNQHLSQAHSESFSQMSITQQPCNLHLKPPPQTQSCPQPSNSQVHQEVHSFHQSRSQNQNLSQSQQTSAVADTMLQLHYTQIPPNLTNETQVTQLSQLNELHVSQSHYLQPASQQGQTSEVNSRPNLHQQHRQSSQHAQQTAQLTQQKPQQIRQTPQPAQQQILQSSQQTAQKTQQITQPIQQTPQPQPTHQTPQPTPQTPQATLPPQQASQPRQLNQQTVLPTQQTQQTQPPSVSTENSHLQSKASHVPLISQCQHKSESPAQLQSMVHMNNQLFDHSGSSQLAASQFSHSGNFVQSASHNNLDPIPLMGYTYSENTKDFFNLSVLAASYDPGLAVDMQNTAENLSLSLDLSVHNNLDTLSQNPQNLSLPHNIGNLQHSMTAVSDNITVPQNLVLPQSYVIPHSMAAVGSTLTPPPSFSSHTHNDSTMPCDLSLMHQSTYPQNLTNDMNGQNPAQSFSRLNTNEMIPQNIANFGSLQSHCSLHNSNTLNQNINSLSNNINKASNMHNTLPQNLSTISDGINSLPLNIPLLQQESIPQNLTAQRLASVPQNLSNFSQYLPQSIPQNLSLQNDFSASYSSNNSTQFLLPNTVHDLSAPQNLSAPTDMNNAAGSTDLSDDMHKPQNLSQSHISQPENLSLPQNLSIQSSEKKSSCMAQPQNLSITNNTLVSNIPHKDMTLERVHCNSLSENAVFQNPASHWSNSSNVDNSRQLRSSMARNTNILNGQVDNVPLNLNALGSSSHHYSAPLDSASASQYSNMNVPASFNQTLDMSLALACPMPDIRDQKFGAVPQNLSNPGKLKQCIQDLSCSSKVNRSSDLPQNLSLHSQPQNLSQSLPQNLSNTNKSVYSNQTVDAYLAQPQNLTLAQNWM